MHGLSETIQYINDQTRWHEASHESSTVQCSHTMLECQPTWVCDVKVSSNGTMLVDDYQASWNALTEALAFNGLWSRAVVLFGGWVMIDYYILVSRWRFRSSIICEHPCYWHADDIRLKSYFVGISLLQLPEKIDHLQDDKFIVLVQSVHVQTGLNPVTYKASPERGNWYTENKIIEYIKLILKDIMLYLCLANTIADDNSGRRFTHCSVL